MIQSDNLTINDRAVRQIAQNFNEMRVLMIEGLVPPRE